jgi:hypothetical protein
MANESEPAGAEECTQCIHHWLIDEKNLGVCKKCGESKQFSNTWSAASIQKAWGSRAGKAQPGDPGVKS